VRLEHSRIILDPEEEGAPVPSNRPEPAWVREGTGARDFEGKVDGTGTKLSLSGNGKVPMELIPACVLERTNPCFGIALIDYWGEGASDENLFKAWDWIKSNYPEGGETAFLRGVAAVLAFGAKKYASDNWRRGIPWRALVGAIQRHYYLGILAGEWEDSETGLPHWFHIGCCLAFLIEYATHRDLYGKLDNRFIRPEAE